MRRNQSLATVASGHRRGIDAEDHGHRRLVNRDRRNRDLMLHVRDGLADRDVFVLPGSMINAPDYFRISLTASDEMVERALPAFGEVARPAR